MKRILLTGATGFLGSQIAERLLARGQIIACPVRNIQNLRRLQYLCNQVKLIPIERLESGIAEFKADTVIHTACAYARGSSTWQDMLDANLMFPLRVLEEVKKHQRIRWINTDTCLPIYLNEYALSKKQFCQWGKYYGEQNELQFINLQLEHFYGPNAPEDQFLEWAIRKLKKNEPLELTIGTQKRDFVYIGGVLDVYEAMLEKEMSAVYINVPVGTGEAPTIREVIEHLKKCVNSSSELRFGVRPLRDGEPNSCCDTNILKSLGIGPFTQWREGMRQYILSTTADCVTGGLNGI